MKKTVSEMTCFINLNEVRHHKKPFYLQGHGAIEIKNLRVESCEDSTLIDCLSAALRAVRNKVTCAEGTLYLSSTEVEVP